MQQAATHEAKALRDAGAALAAENAGKEWREQAIKLCSYYFRYIARSGALFERAKQYASSAGIEAPPSANAWGAVCLAMSRKGLIVKTDRYECSTSPSSHARVNPVWIWNHQQEH
jgi:hypothetical protein